LKRVIISHINSQFVEKQEEMTTKEYAMIKIKWSKNLNVSYTEDMLKFLFAKYGEIKDVVVFPNKRKALIEFRFRLSAVNFSTN